MFFVQAANAVVKNNLSLIIFPEGTRSKNGRLLPFKKARSITVTDHLSSLLVIKQYWWSMIRVLFIYMYIYVCVQQGFVHLALQTRRPIIPIILTGTHRAWRKGSMHVRPAPLTVRYLPPIRTDDWTANKIEDYVKLVHDVYAKNLPDSQRPI